MQRPVVSNPEVNEYIDHLEIKFKIANDVLKYIVEDCENSKYAYATAAHALVALKDIDNDNNPTTT